MLSNFWHNNGDAVIGLIIVAAVIVVAILFTWAMIEALASENRKKEICYSHGYSEYHDDYCFRLVDGNTEMWYVGEE